MLVNKIRVDFLTNQCFVAAACSVQVITELAKAFVFVYTVYIVITCLSHMIAFFVRV